ncbi:sel1 repeat family protein, partial [Acidithiobacillus ferrooxidans]|nr:sel1 repeat family protein [Acidithiobacillus ferrooxidans]
MKKLLLSLTIALVPLTACAAENIQQLTAEALKGDPSAEEKLGNYYHDHPGLQHSGRKANYWFLMAATKGNVKAEYRIGYDYDHTDEGVTKNYSKAEYWKNDSPQQLHQVFRSQVC